MKLKFTNESVLVIVPRDSVEAMALRYWWEEYQKHGAVMLSVETDVPLALPNLSAD